VFIIQHYIFFHFCKSCAGRHVILFGEWRITYICFQVM
jgi:hypothetical protein